MRSVMTIAKPIFTALNFSDSSWESAQASLHCLLSDEAPQHSGQYFSQHSVLYRDKECRKGGFSYEVTESTRTRYGGCQSIGRKEQNISRFTVKKQSINV